MKVQYDKMFFVARIIQIVCLLLKIKFTLILLIVEVNV